MNSFTVNMPFHNHVPYRCYPINLPTKHANWPQQKLHQGFLTCTNILFLYHKLPRSIYENDISISLLTFICKHTTYMHKKHTDTPIPHVVLPLCPHHNIHVHVPYAHMSHHLHLILLYSPQHLLPTSSVL